MCQSYCSKGNIQPWGPQDTEFVCNKYCHYDLVRLSSANHHT
jgi:hypothetical protein